MRIGSKSWERNKPAIGQRVRVKWRDADGKVTAIPYGTCVDIRLDDGREIGLCGNDYADSVDDGSIQLLTTNPEARNDE